LDGAGGVFGLAPCCRDGFDLAGHLSGITPFNGNADCKGLTALEDLRHKLPGRKATPTRTKQKASQGRPFALMGAL
jgi:hypothetical protein